jgi:hypothetical protein
MTKAGEEITVDIRSTTIFRKESGPLAGCASPHRSLLGEIRFRYPPLDHRFIHRKFWKQAWSS